ncbi:39S ribosomal protein L1, mitochondrial [Intoshia linei]|uniref:39S ribosomal protein L1, mitochondrial n=1 Tax=Intoshia linei TaxID=1819745 RepID=A0A177AV67_9BILA|nr:39S ribosomal protein L1, mitochondrial [Intoshia linei]
MLTKFVKSFIRNSRKMRRPHESKPREKMIKKIKSENENITYWADNPSESIYIKKFYNPVTCSFTDAINNHREFAIPEMGNFMQNTVEATVKLDTRTKKKTQFLSDFNSTVLIPHTIQENYSRYILFVTMSEEERTIADKLNIDISGGESVIKAIKNGEYNWEQIDYVLCSSNAVGLLSKAKKYIPETKFPSLKKETVSSDIPYMLERFKYGLSYFTKLRSIDDGFTTTTFPIGALNWEISQLYENFQKIVQDIQTKKRTIYGNFILSANLRCLPSDEMFYLNEGHFCE